MICLDELKFGKCDAKVGENINLTFEKDRVNVKIIWWLVIFQASDFSFEDKPREKPEDATNNILRAITENSKIAFQMQVEYFMIIRYLK